MTEYKRNPLHIARSCQIKRQRRIPKVRKRNRNGDQKSRAWEEDKGNPHGDEHRFCNYHMLEKTLQIYFIY